jgi:cytochrome c-type biogenesis protein
MLLATLQSTLGESLRASPPLATIALFGAGVATSVTPCVYPMIPITAGLLSGSATAGGGRWRTVGITATYVLGLALLYATMGLVAGLTGSLFGTIASNRWVLFAMGNLMLLFGLAMLDVFPVNAPQRLVQWASRLGGGGYGGALLLGATSGIVAAPCGAPAFAAVLTWVAATRSGVLGFWYLFVFSIGMTALLVAVGLFSGTLARLPRPGRWMLWIKKGAGVVLIGVAQYYFIRMGTTL